jgi:flotillin
MIAEAEGQVAAQVAQVKADIERQKARALQVKRKLDADVVQPAEASRRAREEEARGRAALVIERGRAEAEALKRVVEAFKTAGSAAREVLVLQQVIPLLGQVSGSSRRLVVDKVAVLPGGSDGAGDGAAKAAIRFAEQMRASLGVDLAAIAKRLQQPAVLKPPVELPKTTLKE